MSAVRNYTAQQLLDRVKQVQNFKGIPKGFWLLGVRSEEDLPNVFDDKIYFFEGERFICVTSATTNPGTTVLRSFERFNAKGAAVMVADHWYNDVWIKGKHQGKVTALLQLGARVKVWRDNNKNEKSGDTGEIQEGFFGINFHPNTHDFNAKTTGTLVNGWSAGCQVVNNMDRYRQIMNAIPANVKVSYCLLNEF
jgi:hypothetical protein